MGFNIEKGIEITTKRSNRSTIYPWADCNPGDSFLIPCEEGKEGTRMSGVVSSAKKFYAKQGLPFKAVSRKAEGGIRVWIVAVEPEA